MIRTIRAVLVLVLVLFVMAACSDEESKDKESKKEKPEEKKEVTFDYPEAPTTAEEIIEQGPGEKFAQLQDIGSGDRSEWIDELSKEYEKLPEKLTAEQAFDFIVATFAMDYKELDKRYDEYDPTYSVDGEKEEQAKQKNIVFLLDSSGSMAGQVSGGVKMDLAKAALNRVMGTLDEGTQIALRVYGHKGSSADSDKQVSCDSSELVYPLKGYDAKSFKSALEKFKPSGWTPIAKSLQLAADDFKGNKGEGVENIIYIISDGIETCDGAPVAAAKNIHESDLNVTVNVIGFDVDGEGKQQLQETATAGGGEFKSVNSKTELNDTLDEMLDAAKEGIQKDIDQAHEGIDLNLWYVKQTRKLRKIHDDFYNLTRKESKFFTGFKNEIKDEGRLKEGAYSEMTDLINERSEVMEQYSKERMEELMQKTEEAFEKAKEQSK